MRAGGDKTAVIFKEKEHSYSSLVDQIEKYYAIVKEQIPTGSIVSIISDYSFESIALFFALHENRNVVVPITTKIEQEQIDRVCV